MSYNMQIKGFTSTGYEVVIQKNVSNKEQFDKMLGTMGAFGLLADRPDKPDETELGIITHVALTHKEDGTLHMAYYHQNVKMESRYTHKYFDADTDRAEFEQWSGLKIDDLPCTDDNIHPKRTAPSAKKYLVALPEPRALIRVTKFIKTDAGYESSHDVERYIMPKSNGTSSSVTHEAPVPKSDEPVTIDSLKGSDEEKDKLRSYLVEEGMDDNDVFKLTGVKDWNGFPDANTALLVICSKKDAPKPKLHFNAAPGTGTDGFKNHHKKQAAKSDEIETASSEKDRPPLEEINF